jgi:alpha-glucosidase
VWSDPKADGSPPNNWQSVFAGPAWTWDARRRQYYMHQFLPGQPQLNVHNPAVQDALLAEARFWLERGADGFRLDAINHSMFDPQLRDNPSDPDSAKTATRPYNMQKHTRSQNHPDVTKFLERIRSLADEFGAIFTVAEIGGPDTMELMKDYTDTGRLRSAYSFDFLYANDLTPERVKQSILKWTDLDETHWPSWAFANHDAPRCVSRWYKGDDVPRFARMTNTLLMSLRGNPILFQGEELGLTQADIAFEDLQDPEAIANWPLTLGRDGARTPMVWTSDTYGRFSNVKPWLPDSEAHRGLAVAKQEKIPTSVLSYTQRLLKVRAASKALRLGALRCLDAAPGLLIFDRSVKEEVVHCVFNLSGTAVKSGTDFLQDADMLIASGWEEAAAGTIPAYSCWIGRRR